MDNLHLNQPSANSEPGSSQESSSENASPEQVSTDASASLSPALGQAPPSLAEENRRLQQQLAQSEQKRADMAADLSEATDSLQQAQMQVAHSEKFSILGELVAGVAHEINNPISCITNNIKFVNSYTQQLMVHIALQQSVLNAPENAVRAVDLEDLEDHAEDIDLGYITEDLPKLIESMAASGSRITKISRSLRTFARADTALKQTYSLHQGIDGTLLILRHRLKAVGKRREIAVQRNYADIPTIQCYPGQINQVFMNVLANAIDAIEDSSDMSMPPQILIGTAVVDSQVIVTIADNAGGMTEAVCDRIFDRQFTTKRVGKGTGLGLSIAHKIVVDTHKGEISCQSTLGEGSTFRIALPVQ